MRRDLSIFVAGLAATVGMHCGSASDAPADSTADADAGAVTSRAPGPDAEPNPVSCGDGGVSATGACDAGPAPSGDCRERCKDEGAEAVCATADGPCLAITAETWMSELPGSTSLAALSVPGTHDSGARYEPLSGTAKCQNLTIADQLNAGVRYLDIRARHYQNTFQIHHGPIFQNATFDDVLGEVFGFLDAHVDETVMMSVKEEYDAAGDTETFEQTFDGYVQKRAAGWYLGESIPTLQTARGKIVLVRRFSATAPKGLDASGWADNATFTLGGPARFDIQDEYQVSDVNAKWSAVSSLLTAAKGTDPDALFLDYASGYVTIAFIPNIPQVSGAINPKIDAWLAAADRRVRTGVLVMDFIEPARAELVFRKNFY